MKTITIYSQTISDRVSLYKFISWEMSGNSFKYDVGRTVS